MITTSWIGLDAQERALLIGALSALGRTVRGRNADINALATKLKNAPPHPDITVGVHGGQVQWALGNPFPIRICDYDGESEDDLPDVDARGQRCRMWCEPIDTDIKNYSSDLKR